MLKFYSTKNPLLSIALILFLFPFFLSAQVPLITQIIPSSGLPEGGNEVAIMGIDLGNVTHVFFGLTEVQINAKTENSIHVTVPPGPEGSVCDLKVFSETGSSPNCAPFDKYTYTLTPEIAPVIYSISPATGPTDLIIAIHGKNFAEGLQIFFGKIRVDWMYRKSAELVYAVAPPPEAIGSIHVTIQTKHGLSQKNHTDKFLYTH